MALDNIPTKKIGDPFLFEEMNEMVAQIRKNAEDIAGAVGGFQGDISPTDNFIPSERPKGYYNPTVLGANYGPTGDKYLTVPANPDGEGDSYIYQVVNNGVTISLVKTIVPTGNFATKPEVDPLILLSSVNTSIFNQLSSLDDVWKTRAQGIISVKIQSADPDANWYVQAVRAIGSPQSASFVVSKLGSAGAVNFAILASEVNASSTKIVTKKSTLSDGSIIEATVDFNKVTVNWNTAFDVDTQLTINRDNIFPLIPSSTEITALATDVNKQKSLSTLTPGLFRDPDSLDSIWYTRGKGIKDIKVFTNDKSKDYYVAIIRTVAATQSAKFVISRLGSNGTENFGILKSEVDASSTKIITKSVNMSNGDIVQATVDFNQVTVDWNNVAYDNPDDVKLVVSKSRFFDKTDVPPDLTAKVDTVYDFKSTNKTAILWKNNFTDISWLNGSNAWTLSSGVMSTSASGTSNALTLNRQYDVEKKYTRVRFSMPSGASLVLQGTGKENRTDIIMFMVTVNSDGTFELAHKASAGSPSPTVDDTGTFSFVANRQYVLEVWKSVATFRARIYDTVTGGYDEILFSLPGYTTVTDRERFGIYKSAGSTLNIYDFEISVERSDVMFVGDSITHGVGPTVANPSTRWADIVMSRSAKKGLLSGRWGGQSVGVLEKISTENAYILPAYAVVMIGTNNTTYSYTTWSDIVDANNQLGIITILVCNPAKNDGTHIAKNDIIRQVAADYGLYCVRADIATSINNDITQGQDASLFTDGVHPNDAGNLKIADRFSIDAPIVLQ